MKRVGIEDDNKKAVAKKWILGKNSSEHVGEDTIVRLVGTNDGGGLTPLHWACREGRASIVQLLLDKKASVGTKDGGGLTPLHWACRKGRTSIVKLLLDGKACFDGKDRYGWTPLHRACLRGNTAIAKLLLDGKASVDAKDVDGVTPLDYAGTNKELVQLLKTNDERQRLIMVKWMKRHLSTIFNKCAQYDTTGFVSPFLTICSQYM